jgi:hypothetical protein
MGMSIRLARVLNWSDERIQGTARYAPALLRVVEVAAWGLCLVIGITLTSVAGGLAFSGVLLRETALVYAALATLAVMAGLLTLILRFRHKMFETLASIKDLRSLSEYLLDRLFEAVQEVVVAVGIAAVILGAAAALVSHLAGRGWISPVSVALVGVGKLELVLGGGAALLLRRLFADRLKGTARQAIDWAHTRASNP